MRRDDPGALTELVGAVLECTAPVALIIDHMARAKAPAGVPPATDVLRSLLRDVLAPLETMLGEDDLRTTTAVLQAAVPLIVENLLLGPHDVSPSRPRSRTRRRRP
jgi:hypothetical protein